MEKKMFKRTHTAIAAVKTVLLAIPRKHYEYILVHVLQQELEEKLKTISSLPFL